MEHSGPILGRLISFRSHPSAHGLALRVDMGFFAELPSLVVALVAPAPARSEQSTPPVHTDSEVLETPDLNAFPNKLAPVDDHGSRPAGTVRGLELDEHRVREHSQDSVDLATRGDRGKIECADERGRRG